MTKAAVKGSTPEHLIHVRDFERLSRLPASALVWLLTHDALPCVTGSDGQLLINIAAVDFDQLTRSLTESGLEDFADDLLLEKIRTIISRHFATIVEDALSQPVAPMNDGED